MNPSLFRHAFVLLLLSLIGAFFVPNMAVPRLGLSAHTIGVLSAALLLGIPHVVLDDRHGKISSFRDAWTTGVRGSVWANSRSEAAALAGTLRTPAGAPDPAWT